MGVILPTDYLEIAASKALPDKIPHLYWNAASALYRLSFHRPLQAGSGCGRRVAAGWVSVAISQRFNDRLQQWQPNARYWVLKLIKDNFHPGDTLVDTTNLPGPPPDIAAQGFLTPAGKKILVVNKRNYEVTVKLPEGFEHARLSTVDEQTGDSEPRAGTTDGVQLKMAPFAVTVVQTP